MRRPIDVLARPGVAVCLLAALLAVGLLVPGETKLLEFSDPTVPATVGSDPSVTVATVDPTTFPSPSSPAGPPPDESPVATVTTDPFGGTP